MAHPKKKGGRRDVHFRWVTGGQLTNGTEGDGDGEEGEGKEGGGEGKERGRRGWKEVDGRMMRIWEFSSQ